jgi:DNA repair protein RadC
MRPRERYVAEGPERLKDDELIALVVATGSAGRSALDIARDLLEQHGGLPALLQVPPAAYAHTPGVGMARAIQLHAALQAGRRASVERAPSRETVLCSKDAWRQLRADMEFLEVEELHALFLDRKKTIIQHQRLTRGSDAFTVVDPRQIFRAALMVNASCLILAHNHPSGDPEPSEADRCVTRRIAEAGRQLGLPLLDHIIVGRGTYCSMADRGALAGFSDLEPRLVQDQGR